MLGLALVGTESQSCNPGWTLPLQVACFEVGSHHEHLFIFGGSGAVLAMPL